MDERIVLLDAGEIMGRLKRVDDDPYLVMRFYPQLIEKLADRECFPEEFLLALDLTIHDCRKSSNLPAEFFRLMWLNVPLYIDALIDDAKLAKTTKEIHKQSLNVLHQ